MTAAGAYHLPADDPAPVRLVLEALAKLGVTPSEGQRRTLEAAHRYGWLTGEDGIARIIADCSPAARAARARQRVRSDGLADAERRFHASQQHPRQTRAWSETEKGFFCHLCKREFHLGIDRRDTAIVAREHTKTCEGSASDA